MWLSETALKCGLFTVSTGEVSWQSARVGVVHVMTNASGQMILDFTM